MPCVCARGRRNGVRAKLADLPARDNPSLATGVSVLADRRTSKIAIRRKILSDMLEACTKIRKRMGVDTAGIRAEAAGINWHCRDSP